MVTSRHFDLSTTKERIVLRYGHNELCHYMVEIILENPVHPTNRVILSLCKLKSLNLK